MRIIDKSLVGKRFGRLVVLSYTIDRVQGSHRKWTYVFLICRCDCGTTCQVRRSDLLRKRGTPTRSCGCLFEESIMRGTNYKHGMTLSKEYRAWQNAKNRCYDSTNLQYKDYGGRGIQMCTHWKNSFENFYADMGPCPPGLTLERINNEKGYVIGNCKWATRREQDRNKRTNVWLEFQGKRMIIADWVRYTGAPYGWLLRLKNHMEFGNELYK